MWGIWKSLERRLPPIVAPPPALAASEGPLIEATATEIDGAAPDFARSTDEQGRTVLHDAAGAPRVVIDALGRATRWRPATERRAMPLAEQARAIVAWMRTEGWSGWHAGVDITEFCELWAEASGVTLAPLNMLAGEIRRQPGVKAGRYKMSRDLDPEIAWILVWKRLPEVRVTYIPTDEDVAALGAPAKPRVVRRPARDARQGDLLAAA